MELRGGDANVPESELELSRAIVEATVDDARMDGDRTLLVKRLPSG
jgi:hypothetical protein